MNAKCIVCAIQNDCGLNANCVQEIGSFNCVCHSGVKDDRKSCEDCSMLVGTMSQ